MLSSSSRSSSADSLLELKMWKKSAMSRIEYHQGQKRRLSKMFRQISPETTLKYTRSRKQEVDWDVLGGFIF